MGPLITPIYTNASDRDARSPAMQVSRSYHRSVRERATIIDCVRRLSRPQRSTPLLLENEMADTWALASSYDGFFTPLRDRERTGFAEELESDE